MGHGEPRREVHPASDDLDVARRFPRGGPGQGGVELTERGDFRREPALAAQRRGQGVILPGGEVVALLNIGVQGLEATMGRSESRRVVSPASDDLDVAR